VVALQRQLAQLEAVAAVGQLGVDVDQIFLQVLFVRVGQQDDVFLVVILYGAVVT